MTEKSYVLELNKRKVSICIIETIERYCFEPDITIQFIASHCGCSEGYVRQICRTTFGCSPHSIIQAHRIEKACTLIAGTQNSLSEISKMCGYGTEKAFRAAFKRIHNISPQEYRNIMLREKEKN